MMATMGRPKNQIGKARRDHMPMTVGVNGAGVQSGYAAGCPSRSFRR
jgi:hypothetical protein